MKVCLRCAGTRRLHVTRVVDRTPRPADTSVEPQSTVAPIAPGWRLRPVGVRPSKDDRATRFRSAPVDPVGRFETTICRRCGYTAWYAKEWEALAQVTNPLPCHDCEAATPHVRREAVEGGGMGYEPMHLTYSRVGLEGFLDLSICVPCGRTSWIARDYQYLEDRYTAPYKHVDEPDRPCLECGAKGTLSMKRAVEYDSRDSIPVTTRHHELFGALTFERSAGGFALRACLSCNYVEWYATQLDQVKVDPGQGVFALGDDADASSLGGPYR